VALERSSRFQIKKPEGRRGAFSWFEKRKKKTTRSTENNSAVRGNMQEKSAGRTKKV